MRLATRAAAADSSPIRAALVGGVKRRRRTECRTADGIRARRPFPSIVGRVHMPARITIDGNLTADPDFGVSNAGTSWAHLRIASHDRVKRNGEWISTDPEFFNVTLFGKAAEDTANSLMKGDRVTVEG